MHPEVAHVLRQAQELQSLMDDQLRKMNNETFTAMDATETVEVTLNGHHWLTGVYIEQGLIRLGAEVIESRLNEALRKATMIAADSIAADRERIDAAIVDITGHGIDEW